MAAVDGSEDVDDFLQRIKELNYKRDLEDEQRKRRLEEQILHERRERQARRAERSRSISPTKSSSSNTPASGSPGVQFQHHPRTTTSTVSSRHEPAAAMGDAPAAFAISIMSRGRPKHDFDSMPEDHDMGEISSIDSPLAWQHRPVAPSSDRPRVNANGAQKADGDEPLPTRDQIAHALSSKEPAWFRQTADRGAASPAYRKHQVEDVERADYDSTSSRVQLHGMSHEALMRNAEQTMMTSRSPSISPFKNGGFGGSSRSPYGADTVSPISPMGSPIPVTDAQKFDPPGLDGKIDACGPAMSPSQGRISPDRLDRPISPTKGMGGFVQSAMMKRSDSVSKRWNVQSSPGLNRGNSVASNRSSKASSLVLGGVGSISSRPSSPSKDSTARPYSRPGSSHNIAAVTEDHRRPDTSSSMHSVTTSSNAVDTFTSPIQTSSSRGFQHSAGSELHSDSRPLTPEEPLPMSPSKTMDSRRWSPTKSSWLESALNKPESPKPKVSPAPPQPSWLAELNKAKTKDSQPDNKVSASKHEVSKGGLIKSPPLGSSPKSISASGTMNGSAATLSKKSVSASKPRSGSVPKKIEGNGVSSSKAPPAAIPAAIPKPDITPIENSRPVLKPRQLPTGSGANGEPEFKSVFGQLRKTKTQNYVAPDEFKNNILRGKAALNATGGPKKTERVDDFKEAILKKKEDFKKSQTEGRGVTRAVSGGSQDSTVPEALAKRKAMGRSNSILTDSGSVASDSSVRDSPPVVSQDIAKRKVPGKLNSIITDISPAKSDLGTRQIPSATHEIVPKWKPSAKINTSSAGADAVMPKPSPITPSTASSKTSKNLPKWKTSAKISSIPPGVDLTSSESSWRTAQPPAPSKTPETKAMWKTSLQPQNVVAGTGTKQPDSPPRNVQSTTTEVIPKWKMSTKASVIATEASTDSPSKVSSPVSPDKETSAPGRPQGKESVSNKLASRVNPALAGMLSRGPPSAASETTSRSPSVTSSQRTLSVSTSTADAESAEPAPQLTHVTKGRARGPPRKAPSTSAPGKVLSVVEEVPSTSELLPAKAFVAAPKLAPVKALQEIVREQVRSPGAISPSEIEVKAPQAASPQRQEFENRSLKEVSNHNGKTTPLTSSPESRSPIKRVDILESPAKPDVLEADLVSEVKSKSGPANFKAQHLSELRVARNLESPVKTSPQELLENLLNTDPSNGHRPTETTIAMQQAKSVTPTPNLQHTSMGADVPPQSSQPSVTKDEVRKSEMRLEPQPTQSTNREADGPPSDTANAAATEPLQASYGEEPSKSTGINISNTIRDASPSWACPVVPINMVEAARVISPVRSPRREDERDLIISGGLLLSSPIKTPISPEILFPPVSPIKPTAPLGLAISGTGVRSLPSPPTKAPISPPQSANGAVIPQTSEASWLVAEFFGGIQSAPTFVADTATILTTRPEQTSRIKTVRSTLFQLFPDGKKHQVPSSQERLLFEGGMYLCVHSFKNAQGKNTTEVYYWSGDNVPIATVEETAIFAQREARSWSAGGKLIKVQQGKEPLEFLQALGGIVIIRRGSSSKYDSLAPHMLCARQQFGSVVFDEVDMATSSLCSGFPFLISTQSGKCLLWKGKGSGVDELSCARLVGMDFGLTGEIEEVDDGKEPASFMRIFGRDPRIPSSADHWRLRPRYSGYCGRLFQANASPDNQIQEISPFSQADLLPQKVYILDAFFEIYIIIGSHTQSQYAAFHNALLFAQEYGILAAGMEDRPHVPTSTVVFGGAPRDMKACFRKWKDERTPTALASPPSASSAGSGMELHRFKSLRVVPLTAALDAVRI